VEYDNRIEYWSSKHIKPSRTYDDVGNLSGKCLNILLTGDSTIENTALDVRKIFGDTLVLTLDLES